MTELEAGYRDTPGVKRDYETMDAAGDAYMLLSLKGAPVANPASHSAPVDTAPPPSVPEFVVTSHGKTESQAPMAKLETKGFEYTIRAKRTIIGRDSSNFKVDVNMPLSTFISRKHIEIYFEEPNSFFMICRGKNGVFVDGVFQRRNGPPYKLSPSCVFRFPSTSIRLEFRSLIVDRNANVPSEGEDLDKSLAHPGKALGTHIDGFDGHSPTASPTATISAANSCPSSPRTAANRARFEANLAHKPQDDFKKGMAYAASNVTKEPIVGLEAVDLIKPALPIPILADQQIIAATPTPPPAKKKKPRGESGKSAYRPMTHSGESSGIPTPFIIEPTDDANKPPYSYAQLIVQAIASSPEHQLTLNDIYSWIAKTYPFYRTADKGWQNSIRHNLSLNRYFLKVARCQSEPGKGSFWKIDPTCMEKLTEQSFKKRRQRPNSAAEGAQCVETYIHRGGTPTGPASRFVGAGGRDSLNTSVMSLDFASEADRAAAAIGGQEMLESEIISTDYTTTPGKPTELCYGTVTNTPQPTGPSTFLVHAPGPFVSGQIGHQPHGPIQHGQLQHGPIQHGQLQHGPIQHGQLQHVTVTTHPSGQTVKVLLYDANHLGIVKPVTEVAPPTISLASIVKPVTAEAPPPTVSLAGIVKPVTEVAPPTISLASIVKPVITEAPPTTVSLPGIVKPIAEVPPPTTISLPTESAIDTATTAAVEDITIAPAPPASSNVLDRIFKTD